MKLTRDPDESRATIEGVARKMHELYGDRFAYRVIDAGEPRHEGSIVLPTAIGVELKSEGFRLKQEFADGKKWNQVWMNGQRGLRVRMEWCPANNGKPSDLESDE